MQPHHDINPRGINLFPAGFSHRLLKTEGSQSDVLPGSSSSVYLSIAERQVSLAVSFVPGRGGFKRTRSRCASNPGSCVTGIKISPRSSLCPSKTVFPWQRPKGEGKVLEHLQELKTKHPTRREKVSHAVKIIKCCLLLI